MIYLIGSLRNKEIPTLANTIRAAGFEVFDDWFAAGPEADDKWKEYEQIRGRSYIDALSGAAARNVFSFDKRHLDSADAALLALPAGKSGHLELGYMLGRGRRGYVLIDNPERWDVMYQFATLVTDKLEDIITDLKVDKDIVGVCELCSMSIKVPTAYTNYRKGLAHYSCYEEFLRAQGVEQASFPIKRVARGINIRREADEMGKSIFDGSKEKRQ